MPSAGQLRRARRRFTGLLPDRAIIQRPVEASDGGGGFTQTWPVIASDVPCRLAPVGGGEKTGRSQTTRGDRITDEATAIVTFEAGADVATTDRVVIAGQVFDVLLVRHRGQWELTRRCEVREVRP
jgi:hypothetical protein